MGEQVLVTVILSAHDGLADVEMFVLCALTLAIKLTQGGWCSPYLTTWLLWLRILKQRRATQAYTARLDDNSTTDKIR
jgi:hypothetical protein